MKVKVFQSNHNGKIEFTRAELEKLLNEVYTDGYNEGKSSHWTWTSPSISTTPYYNTITTTNTTDPFTATCDSVTTAIDNSIATASADKVSTAKETNPTYTIKVNGTDISKMVNDIFGARASNNVPENVVDAFDKLAKELNF